ncbi:uncharacterized protein Z519_04802 [Cladophialophora bantiana CBS 173.52]|uniref:Transmembrane protein n=1 Tax=Cladophialophora bantiana (strain ATCC 10958 / CBS 173.52 / CDC B-1940 / NIH 8579) TaxID=1442370 RepID=A0A0D2IDI5_CLAB1|nr:uncharacterized protein Z519_04802 [Cladophialophora bantiana CBS 173.52]KIW94824.1 hypothetical protein Z519_04802 [Cladophialophora bantiana CBS 173.52]
MTSPLARPSRHVLALLLCLDFLEYSRALAQSGDGGGAQGVEPGDIGSSPGSSTEDAGAAGPDTGSVNLSRGATIAIALVVSIIVVLGGTMTILFYLAKKRQWKIKESIRRSARRFTSAVKAVTTPITPKKMTFSPVEKRRLAEDTLKKANDQLSRSKSDATNEKKPGSGSRSSSTGSSRDLEKGLTDSAVKVETRRENDAAGGTAAKKDKERPRLPSVTIPSSAFEMDSPKTPLWKRVFGR